MKSTKFPKASGDLDPGFGNDGLAPFPVELRIVQSKRLSNGTILTGGSEM